MYHIYASLAAAHAPVHGGYPGTTPAEEEEADD